MDTALQVKGISLTGRSGRPNRRDAEAAVRTLIEWAGDDADRAGPVDTPPRVVRANEEFFEGYRVDPDGLLATTFRRMLGTFETDGQARREFLSLTSAARETFR
jgi:GTP cyclohydrolase IA